jgi:hypothetical protein
MVATEEARMPTKAPFSLDTIYDAITDELARQQGHRWIDDVSPSDQRDRVFVFDGEVRMGHLLRAIADAVGTSDGWRSLFIATRSFKLDPPPPRDPARKPRPPRPKG